MSLKILSIVAALAIVGSQPAAAATVYGTIVLNISGSFATPVTVGGSVSCGGSALIVPDTSGGVTLSSISAALTLNSGVQTKTAGGTVSSTRKSFTCSVSVPYSFSNFVSGQQIAVFYTVEGHDSGAYNAAPTHPLAVRQLLTLPSMPANGATTTETIKVNL